MNFTPNIDPLLEKSKKIEDFLDEENILLTVKDCSQKFTNLYFFLQIYFFQN